MYVCMCHTYVCMTCQTHIFMQLTSSSSTALLASCAASAASEVLGLKAPLQRPRPANQSAGVSPRTQNAVSDAARAQLIQAYGCSAARPISPGPAHQGEARACRRARYQGTGWVRWKLLQLLPWQTISVSLPPSAGPATTAGDDGQGSVEDMRNAGAIGPSGTKAHVPASSMNAAVPHWSHRAIVARGLRT